MAAQRRRAATGDCSQHGQLLEGSPGSILVQKAGLVRAKDIGHLHGGRLIRAYAASATVLAVRCLKPEDDRVDSALPADVFAKGADTPSYA
jgi:hypothetical protein